MDVSLFRERDLRQIDKLLRGQPIGIIADPWMRQSLIADFNSDGGQRILPLTPDHIDQVDYCAAVLIHSQWPDEGPWMGQMLPRFGEKMLELVDACFEGGEFSKPTVRKPILYWHLEGGNPHVKGMFDHFAAVASVIGTTAPSDVEYWETHYPGTPVLHVPMAASSVIFGIPHLPRSQSAGVIFPGRWYPAEKERCDFLRRLLTDLDYHDLLGEFMITEWGDKMSWPEEFHPYIVPAMPFSKLGQLYRAMRLGINHNLWKGGVAMRYPCMAMAGLPVLSPHGSVGDMLVYWEDHSRFAAMEGAMTWRLTERVLMLLKAAKRDGGEPCLVTV